MNMGTPGEGAVTSCSTSAPSRVLTVPSSCPSATCSPGRTAGSPQPAPAEYIHLEPAQPGRRLPGGGIRCRVVRHAEQREHPVKPAYVPVHRGGLDQAALARFGDDRGDADLGGG